MQILGIPKSVSDVFLYYYFLKLKNVRFFIIKRGYMLLKIEKTGF